jgi:hypothetical protein
MPHESTNPTGSFRFNPTSGACDSLPAKAGSHTKSRTGGFRLQAEVERG